MSGGTGPAASDPYLDGTFQWWHLSRPSPELERALEEGWLPRAGRALDVGCGLGTEVAWLTALGLQAIGIDISEVACARAQLLHPEALFLYADVRRLPFADGVFDLALDRGCFHYLKPSDRARYASEVGRVLRPGGRLLLRASLRRAGRRNDLDEPELRRTFAAWRVRGLGAELIPSDTRSMEVLVARLERP